MSKKRILIADDDGTTRWLLMEMLQGSYETVCVANGKQLCTLLNQCQDEFDLVIADIHMPAWGAEHLDPAKAIQGCVFSADLMLQGCALPVIYISGDTGREFALHKPIREDVLKAVIEDRLAG